MSLRGVLDSRAAAFAAIAATILAGCQSLTNPFKSDERPQPQPSAYGAVFAPKNGSVAGGYVRVSPRDDGVALTVYVSGIRPGQFRVAFHATGNCSSPNAFSAGPAWSPPGVEPARLLLAASTEGDATLSIRLRGYKIDGAEGLIGKSVLLHEAATGSLDAQPGVPNGRLACGIIGPMRSLVF